VSTESDLQHNSELVTSKQLKHIRYIQIMHMLEIQFTLLL